MKSSIEASNSSLNELNFFVRILETLLPTNLIPNEVITLCKVLDFDFSILSNNTLTDFSPNPSIFSKSSL